MPVGLAAGLSLVPSALYVTGAQAIQVLAASVGALVATAGFGLLRSVWRRWRQSDLLRFLAALGCYLICAGTVLMLAGIGIYH